MSKKECEVKVVETIERPKMPRATWDALRAHIQRERARKKQEIEQTQEVERLKKERERKKKQEKVTLEDTKEQIAALEARLAKFKEEKHQLFHTLKKVLLEDQSRRRKDSHPNHMYMQPTNRQNPIYMKPPPHMFVPQASAASSLNSSSQPPVTQTSSKRQRSPSPSPRPSSIPTAYSRPGQYRSTPISLPIGVTAGYLNSNVTYSLSSGSPHNSSGTVTSVSNSQALAAAAAAAHYPFTTTAARSAAAAVAAQVQAEEDRNKLYAAAVAARNYDRAALAATAAAAQRLSMASAPPAAHVSAAAAATLSQVYRSGGSIMSGYPRFPAPVNVTDRSSPTLRGNQPPNGTPGMRFYGALPPN